MKALLSQRLEENKYELYWSLKELIAKYYMNIGSEREFIACITPKNIPCYWLNARRVIEIIERSGTDGNKVDC